MFTNDKGESQLLNFQDFYEFKKNNLLVGNLFLDPDWMYTKEFRSKQVFRENELNLDDCEKILEGLIQSRHSYLFMRDFDPSVGIKEECYVGKGPSGIKGKGNYHNYQTPYVNLSRVKAI